MDAIANFLLWHPIFLISKREGDDMYQKRSVMRFLLDLLYPNRCPCCNGFICWDALICTSCMQALHVSEDLFCPRCGKTYSDCICSDDLPYDRAFAMSIYQKPARNGILSLKTGTNLNFGEYAGIYLADQIERQSLQESLDMIIPVPSTASKRRERGYNQAEVIGKALGKRIHVPIRTDILWKDKQGKQQHLLSAEERRKNIQQFQIHPVDLTGYHIVLCDDVLTTGSTICRCASLLKQCGAEWVIVAVAATTEQKE